MGRRPATGTNRRWWRCSCARCTPTPPGPTSSSVFTSVLNAATSGGCRSRPPTRRARPQSRRRSSPAAPPAPSAPPPHEWGGAYVSARLAQTRTIVLFIAMVLRGPDGELTLGFWWAATVSFGLIVAGIWGLVAPQSLRRRYFGMIRALYVQRATADH